MLTYIFVIRRSLAMASSIFLSTGGTPCLLTLQLTTCISRKRHARHMPMFGLRPSLAGVPTEQNENHPCGSGTPYGFLIPLNKVTRGNYDWLKTGRVIYFDRRRFRRFPYMDIGAQGPPGIFRAWLDQERLENALKRRIHLSASSPDLFWGRKCDKFFSKIFDNNSAAVQKWRCLGRVHHSLSATLVDVMWGFCEKGHGFEVSGFGGFLNF